MIKSERRKASSGDDDQQRQQLLVCIGHDNDNVDKSWAMKSKKKKELKKSVVDHTYRDYSQVEVSDLLVNQDHTESNEDLFPSKLHKILATPEYANIIAWKPHGRAWAVIDKTTFISYVLPAHFNHANFESFNRSVNGWGFKRLHQDGPDNNAYYHELFLRGKFSLVGAMSRLVNPGKRLPSKDDEPDFYAISRKYPTAETSASEEHTHPQSTTKRFRRSHSHQPGQALGGTHSRNAYYGYQHHNQYQHVPMVPHHPYPHPPPPPTSSYTHYPNYTQPPYSDSQRYSPHPGPGYEYHYYHGYPPPPQPWPYDLYHPPPPSHINDRYANPAPSNPAPDSRTIGFKRQSSEPVGTRHHNELSAKPREAPGVQFQHRSSSLSPDRARIRRQQNAATTHHDDNDHRSPTTMPIIHTNQSMARDTHQYPSAVAKTEVEVNELDERKPPAQVQERTRDTASRVDYTHTDRAGTGSRTYGSPVPETFDKYSPGLSPFLEFDSSTARALYNEEPFHVDGRSMYYAHRAPDHHHFNPLDFDNYHRYQAPPHPAAHHTEYRREEETFMYPPRPHTEKEEEEEEVEEEEETTKATFQR